MGVSIASPKVSADAPGSLYVPGTGADAAAAGEEVTRILTLHVGASPYYGSDSVGNVSLKRRGCSVEDGQADLRAACGAVVGVAGPGVVDLTHGSCNLEGLLAHVGAESRVGDVDVVVRAGVDRGGQVDSRDDERCHRPVAGGIGDWDVGHHGASLLGEQLIVVQPARWPGPDGADGAEHSVEFAHGAVVPGEYVAEIHDVADRSDGCCFGPAAVHLQGGGVGLKEAAQRDRGRPGLVKLGLQALQVMGDEVRARVAVGHGD